jgi:hypothetical protein
MVQLQLLHLQSTSAWRGVMVSQHVRVSVVLACTIATDTAARSASAMQPSRVSHLHAHGLSLRLLLLLVVVHGIRLQVSWDHIRVVAWCRGAARHAHAWTNIAARREAAARHAHGGSCRGSRRARRHAAQAWLSPQHERRCLAHVGAPHDERPVLVAAGVGQHALQVELEHSLV